MIAKQRRLKDESKNTGSARLAATRYGSETDRKLFFDEISAAALHIGTVHPRIRRLPSAIDKTILEIGVGAGADFKKWCGHARHATGVDLTEKAIGLTKERLELNHVPRERYALQTADAENLPFDNDSCDLVYSWGVLHHTPDTQRAFREVFRVLRGVELSRQ